MTALANADFAYLRGVVFRHSQNVLEAAHDHLFRTRLSGLLRRHGLAHLHELVRLLRSSSNPGLERAIAEAMTINETSFFRDCRTFDALRTEVLPRLIDSRLATRRLRVWSAACSTGQEAYSLAMLVREHFPLALSWDIRIEGTDLSADVVERARLGRYHRIEMNRGLPARLLVRYFDRMGEDWVVKPAIATLCRFRQANLCAPLPFQQGFDLILLRNLMIYLSMEARLSLLASIRRLIAPDGYLILGSAEQVPDRSVWTTVFTAGSTYYRPS
jgi:chemotaxis protein methyltransferase CheR